MKSLLKIFSLLIIATLAFATQSQAQRLTSYSGSKTTMTAPDTAIIDFSVVPGDVLAFHFKAEKVSGTAAGTATLQGSNDNTNWTTVGSAFTITNLAHNQTVIEPLVLSWTYYRWYVLTSGTNVLNLVRGYTMRRSGQALK